MRRLRLLLAATLAAACGGAPPIPELAAPRVTAAAAGVAFGKAFPLTVVRTWEKDAPPAEWDDGALAPLAVRLVGTERREDGRRVEETRRYDAWAFTPGDLAEPVPLRVSRAIDPQAPGPAELPGGPLGAPFPWLRWSAAVTIVLAGVVLLIRHRRRRRRLTPPPISAPTEPRPGPHLLALEKIARLRALEPRGRAEIEAYHVEAAALLREYAAERFRVHAAEMTTEQLAAAVGRARLGEALRACDLVKFARHVPDTAERARTLDAAEGFVRETAA